MADTEDKNEKKTLSLSSGKLGLKKPGDNAAQIRQSFSHGRSKAVEVEVKRKRIMERQPDRNFSKKPSTGPQGLSEVEWESRLRAVQHALKTASEVEAQLKREKEERTYLENFRLAEIEKDKQRLEEERLALIEEEARKAALRAPAPLPEPEIATPDPVITTSEPVYASKPLDGKAKNSSSIANEDEEEEKQHRDKRGIKSPTRKAGGDTERGRHDIRQKLHGMSVKDLLTTNEEGDQGRRYGSRRHKDRSRKKHEAPEQKQITRDVIIPDVISVQELANRMAVRGAEVVKKLMSMGVMVTITQNIDADTAELIVGKFGHISKRVSASDVEQGIQGSQDLDTDMIVRPPVVTVMGHVDHGKTSLLDAIRKTDVVAGEAGGITQHIGAYQVTMASGAKITFIDTPGHAAFTDMRARGANVTDLVILVVAADDGIMEQTVEAIHHARAAKVPVIIAINKIDKPHANADRVRQMLLQHEIVVEQMGGDIMSVDVSAKAGTNIDKLEEAILLQAEVMGLMANPHRAADGVIIEAKLERGRGPVATVLVQRGTLKVGDIFVAGSQGGRVRALVDDKGKNLKEALPAQPVEVIGFTGTPSPGDDFIVVESESRAREIAEFRAQRQKNKLSETTGRGTFEQLLTQAQGNKKELAIVIKSDVQGSLEAILSSFQKLSTSEVAVKILYAGVGGISESDVVLAKASNAMVIGFNVRANPQARDLASQSSLEIRYYSIIYNIIDDVKAIMGGLLSPTLHELFLGNAEIRQVFNITKVGKIAGCYITEGTVKRGAKVRLLRDNVVIHEGSLKTLKRIKDEVREVKEGYECGMAFENYQDIREKDIIECFEIQEIARVLA
ncbi:MAG: translation initiation factor IF-2 [Janthinobacterium lividum]